MITRKQIKEWNNYDDSYLPLDPLDSGDGYTFDELRELCGCVEDVNAMTGEVTMVYAIGKADLQHEIVMAMECNRITSVIIGDVEYYYKIEL